MTSLIMTEIHEILNKVEKIEKKLNDLIEKLNTQNDFNDVTNIEPDSALKDLMSRDIYPQHYFIGAYDTKQPHLTLSMNKSFLSTKKDYSVGDICSINGHAYLVGKCMNEEKEIRVSKLVKIKGE